MFATSKSKIPFVQDIFLLVCAFCFFYAIWLGGHSLFTPDEGRYSEIAREMWVSQDYITPRLNGVVFLDKPIFYYWLQVIAMKCFGLSEWSLRFFPALIGVFGCVMTYVAGAFVFNRRTGILSALVLATCPLYYGAAHYANLDLEVAVFISTTLFFLLMGLTAKADPLRKIFLSSAYFFAGIAMLTKGLIAIFFPASIVGLWILILNRWGLLKKSQWVIGIFIFLCVAAPWYVLVQKHNPQFFQFFFVLQQFSRFLTTETFNNQTTFWFYVPVVLVGIFPWVIFVVQSFFASIRQVISHRQENASLLYFLLWFTIVFVFFSIPHSKTIGYILPVLPPVAILIGHYLAKIWDEEKSSPVSLAAFIIIALFICGFSFWTKGLTLLNINNDMLQYIRFIGFIAMFFGLLMFVYRKSLPAVFVFLTMFGILLSLTLAKSSDAINHKSVKPLTQILKPHLTAQDEIVTYFKYYQDLPIYLERRATIVADWNSPGIRYKDNWVREMWYGKAYQDTQAWLIDDKTFSAKFSGDKRLFIFTNVDNYHHLKNKLNLYWIAQQDDIVLFSNKPLR